MTHLATKQLKGPPVTMLIPLWARAVEMERESPIIHDTKAREILERLDFPFDTFSSKQIDQTGFCIRGALMDAQVRKFLEKHPSGTVVEIGPGLDSRFDRLDNGQVHYWEADFPDVIDLRREFYPQTNRRQQIACSANDDSWIERVAQSKPGPLLFSAEGVFYFFDEKELKKLFGKLADRFPGSEIVFDCQSFMFMFFNNWRHPFREPKLKWSLSRAGQIERWDSRFRIVECIGYGDRPYYDPFRNRLSSFNLFARDCFSPIREFFKIVRIQLGSAR